MDFQPILFALVIFGALLVLAAVLWSGFHAEGDVRRDAADRAFKRVPPVEPVVLAKLELQPIDLEPLVIAAIGRWTGAPRRWVLGRTDDATVSADGDALTSAIDGLVRIILRGTDPGDAIDVSIERDGDRVTVVLAGGARVSRPFEAAVVPALHRAVVRAHSGSISETRVSGRRFYRLQLPVAGHLVRTA